MRNKSVLIYFFVIMIILFQTEIFSISANEDENTIFDYAKITDVEYKAEVMDEEEYGGAVLITEKLTFDIHAASKDNLFWELWRDLPEDYIDGLKVNYKVNYVKELNDDGTYKEYTESPKLYWDDEDYTSSIYGPGKWYHSEGPYSEYQRRYEALMIYVDGIYREKVSFEIQYVMYNASLKYKDVSELYLTMYSEETIRDLKSFKADILIKDEDMPSKDNYLVRTYGTENDSFKYTESDTKYPGYHTFSIDLDKKDLKFTSESQFVEFYLLSFNEDVHKFTEYAPNNMYSNEEYLDEALEEVEYYDELEKENDFNRLTFKIVVIIFSILIPIYVLFKIKNIKTKHKYYKPTDNIVFFREIPSDLDPHFAATLVLSKHHKKQDLGDSYSATLLSLVNKGYVNISKANPNENWSSKNTILEPLYKPVNINPTPIQTLNNVDNLLNQNTLNEENVLNDTLSQNNTFNQNNILNQNNVFSNFDNISAPISEEIVTENKVITEPIYNMNTEILDENGKIFPKLSETETLYYNLLIKHCRNNTISMENFQFMISNDISNTEKFEINFKKSIIDIGINNGYFQKSDYKSCNNSLKRTTAFFLIAALALLFVHYILFFQPIGRCDGILFIPIVISLITSFICFKISNKYNLFTQYGEDEYAKWRGLYNFLNSNTLMNERTHIELPLWEKYLIYATAFGISEKVIKVLEIQVPESSESPILKDDYYRSSHFRSSSNRSFRTTTRTASRSSYHARTSSYGSGGRGGGGGGGGH